MKVHKRPANGTDKSESAPKKAKQAEPEESEEDERNKRTLFVRNLPFTATDEQVNICLHFFLWLFIMNFR